MRLPLFSKDQEIIDRERKNAREEELLKKLTLFPGSVEEYKDFRGYDIEVADTERPDKGVFLDYYGDRELIASLMDKKGVEALVNISFKAWGNRWQTDTYLYGLPVRRKAISPVDDHTHDLP